MDQSAQLKPGLPQIGSDPISQALAWVRAQAKNVGTAIGNVSNQVVNKSALGNAAQGKFNQVVPALKQEFQDVGYAPKPGEKPSQQIERMLNKNMFAGEMELTPSVPVPQAKPSNFFEKQAMKINQVDDVKLPSEVGGAQAEARMQNTLNKVVPGGNLSQKYANLKPTMDKIGARIQQKLVENPTTIPAEEIKTTLLQKLRPLVDNGTIPEREAEKQVVSYMARIYGSSVNFDGLPPIENTMKNGKIIPFSETLQLPQDVPDSVLYRMKTLANDRARGLFGKENLNAAQQTTLALRNGFDDILTKYRPDIKDLTLTQSDLFRAAEQGNLGGLREKSTGIGISVPGTNVKIGVPGFVADPLIRRPLSAILNGDKRAILPLAVGAGAAGEYALSQAGNQNGGIIKTTQNNSDGQYDPQTGEIKNENAGGNIQGQGNHNNSITPDVNGNYNLPIQTSPGGTFMTQAQRQALEANLTPGTPEYEKVERDFAADQERAAQQLPNNARSFMNNAPTYMQTFNESNKALQSLPTDLVKHFKTGQEWKAYMSNPNNPYAQHLSTITKLDTQYIAAYRAIYGNDPGADQLIGAGDSNEQMREKWANMMKDVYNNYSKFLDPFNAVTSPGGAQTPGGAPIAAPHIVEEPPQNANSIVGGQLPSLNLPQLNLPNIPQ